MIDPRGIEGWMSPEELDWLADQAGQSDETIEIGIWKGRSTYTICKHARGHVYAVDHWRGAPGQESDYPDPVSAEQSARITLEEFTKSKKLTIIKSYSLEALGVLIPPHVKADFIFIDGAHDAASVFSDIQLCLRRLKPHGIISGHDINWPGVIQAVRAALPVDWNHGPGAIWYRRY